MTENSTFPHTQAVTRPVFYLFYVATEPPIGNETIKQDYFDMKQKSLTVLFWALSAAVTTTLPFSLL